MSSPNFEFSVFKAEEEEDEEVPDEISRPLRQEERSIQPYKESLEMVNLGSEEERGRKSKWEHYSVQLLRKV